jgi:hypothetical protein
MDCCGRMIEGLEARESGMDAKGDEFRAWEWDPHLPVDWRARDAERIIAGETTKWADHDDPHVAKYVEYLRLLADGSGELAAAPWPAIGIAREIAEHDDIRQWELKARLLTGRGDGEIADQCKLSGDTVSWYERIFFSVRDHLHARTYIANRVIGSGTHYGFGDHEVGLVWMTLGFFGGTVVLDAFLGAFHAVWRPWEPATVSVYLRPNSGIDPRIQVNVASLVLPHFGPAGEAWTVINLQLAEADAVEDQDRRALLRERAREALIRCAEAFLAGKPFAPTATSAAGVRRSRYNQIAWCAGAGTLAGEAAGRACEYGGRRSQVGQGARNRPVCLVAAGMIGITTFDPWIIRHRNWASSGSVLLVAWNEGKRAIQKM